MLNENLRLAFKFNANGFPAFAGMTKMEKSRLFTRAASLKSANWLSADLN
jgi:hypothetical protein